MSGNRIVVIGASAGGVEALRQLVGTLPSDFPASILVVVHFPSHGTSVLPNILSRAGHLRALHPHDGDKLVKGQIFIAPPDKHLLVKRGHITLTRGPSENGHRPAIDPLFRTAARTYGRQVIGVVLSGMLDDGTAGLAAIKNRGGVTIVQSPEEAIFPGMPQNAIENLEIDYILPVSEIASLLVRLAHENIAESEEPPSDEIEYETDIAELNMSAIENEIPPGQISTYICPECGGTLWEITDGDVLRYRCHVGHAFTSQTLMSEQNDALEAALWVALRTLEDSSSLAKRMAERARSRRFPHAVERFEKQAQNASEHAKIIRDVLLNGVLGERSAIVDTDEQVAQAQQSEENDAGD